jgi:hypothetical protein
MIAVRGRRVADGLYRRIAVDPPSLRLRARTVLCQAADKVGALELALRRRPGRFIMAYHRVLTVDQARLEWCHPAIWVSPELLDQHLRLFGRLGRIVSLPELLSAGDRGGSSLFAITFDDAWADNHTNGLPVLKRHAATACFFVPTDAVASGQLFWTETVAISLGRALDRGGLEAFISQVCPAGTDAKQLSQEQRLAVVLACVEQLKELSEVERLGEIERLFDVAGAITELLSNRIMTWQQTATCWARIQSRTPSCWACRASALTKSCLSRGRYCGS